MTVLIVCHDEPCQQTLNTVYMYRKLLNSHFAFETVLSPALRATHSVRSWARALTADRNGGPTAPRSAMCSHLCGIRRERIVQIPMLCGAIGACVIHSRAAAELVGEHVDERARRLVSSRRC